LVSPTPRFKVHGTPLGVGGGVETGGAQLSTAAKSGADVAQQVSARV
jgi:hypothetical protein